MLNPKVSIIILNWNGKKWLSQCLASLKNVTYKSFEIIVVNNGSTDDSGKFVKNNYPKVRLIEIEKNIGYAGGNNFGVKHAKGEYVLFLNNDTRVTPNFLEPLVLELNKNKDIGAVQPQIRNMLYKNLLDSVGSFLTFTGFLYHYGYLDSYKKPEYNKPLFVLSIKGACFLIRKKLYVDLGGFDEDFITYVEETDLCHRIWLNGKKILYLPQSYIYHYGGRDMSVMTKGEVTIFRSFRNRIISYIKNLSTWELIKILSVHLVISEIYIFVTILRGKVKEGTAAQKGLLAWIFDLNNILRKRSYVQNKIRKVSDKEILPYIKKNPNIFYFLKFIAKTNIDKY